MCGRFSLTQSAARIAEVFGLPEEPAWTPRYNIAPTQPVATIAHFGPQADRQFRLLRWGLIPSWAKDGAIGNKLINARAESVAEKPSFRSAFQQRRCLMLADGFYEWQKTTSKQKQPYYFQLADHQPFAFAGLWEHWQGPDGPIASCTLITTQANELMEAVHDRMPVILPPTAYAEWLDPDTPADALQALLRPYQSDAMKSYPVSTLVNSPSNDLPAVIQARS